METVKKKREFFTLRYAAIQGCYWAAFCASISYAAVYLQDRGFSNSSIGILLAIGNIFAVIVQPLVAAWVDKSEKITIRQSLCILMAVIVILSGLMCVLSGIIWTVPILFIGICAILQTIQPLNSSLGMECEQYANPLNFGLARGIGSWSFAVLSTLLGMYLTHHKANTLPYIYLVLLLLEWFFIATFRYQDRRMTDKNEQLDNVTDEHEKNEATETHNGLLSFARCYPRFMVFLLGVIMVFFMHMLINTFTINMVENVGGNSKDMGFALGLAAFCELPAMAIFSRLRHKTGVSKLIVFSAIVFSVKHILILFAPNVTILVGLHALQMLSYAIFLPGSIYYVNGIMQKGDEVKGQAYVTMAINIGGIFSSLIGGRIIDAFGFHTMMAIAAVVSIIGTVIMCFSIEPVK